MDLSTRKSTEVKALLKDIPELELGYDVLRKIGEGSFSKVYMATKKDPPTEDLYALKCIISSSEPKRIAAELKYIIKLGGRNNVMGLSNCEVIRGNVIMVMPYFEHSSFMDIVETLSFIEIKEYMKNLLLALEWIHEHGIIHRDIKPSNFLFDRISGQYALVDFGLAQSITKPTLSSIVAPKSKPTSTVSVPTDCSSIINNPIIVDTSKFSNESMKGCKRNLEKALETVEAVRPTKKLCVENFVGSQKLESTRVLQPISTSNRINVTVLPPGSDAIKKPVTSFHKKVLFKEKIIAKEETNTILKENNFNEEDSTVLKEKTATVADNVGLKENDVTVVGDQENVIIKEDNTVFKDDLAVQRQENSNNKEKDSTMIHVLTTPPNNVRDEPVPSKINNIPAAKPPQVKFNSNSISVIPSTSRSFGKPSGSMCECYGKKTICSVCIRKPQEYAPRAGTPGFRPPEVLIRYANQTTSVDMWSAGVIFISLLSRRYPFFTNSDDMVALAEMICLLGLNRVKKAGLRMGKLITIQTEYPAKDLHILCQSLRDNLETNRTINLMKETIPACAVNLLYRLLDPDPATRITAASALEHPFISNKSVKHKHWQNL